MSGGGGGKCPDPHCIAFSAQTELKYIYVPMRYGRPRVTSDEQPLTTLAAVDNNPSLDCHFRFSFSSCIFEILDCMC